MDFVMCQFGEVELNFPVFSEKSLSYLMKVKSFLPQEGLSLMLPSE